MDALYEETQEEREQVYAEPIGFELEEAERVVAVYACAQCEGRLQMTPTWLDDERWFVICPDCGNVEEIGRISKTTVAIRNERGIWDYPRAIRALSDLWGYLIPTKEAHVKILSELGF